VIASYQVLKHPILYYADGALLMREWVINPFDTLDDCHSGLRPIVVIALCAEGRETKMFGFWRCKADAEPETAVETPVAAEPVAAVPAEPEAQPEPVVEVAEVIVADVTAEAPPAAEPEPPKMPHKVHATDLSTASASWRVSSDSCFNSRSRIAISFMIAAGTGLDGACHMIGLGAAVGC
jgi:hypothetical protein